MHTMLKNTWALLALSIPAACTTPSEPAECPDGALSVDGTYATTRNSSTVENIGGAIDRVQIRLTAGATLPNIDGIAPCAVQGGTLPEAVVATHGSSSAAMRVATESITVELKEGAFRRVSIHDFNGAHQCVVDHRGTYTLEGNTLLTSDGHKLSVERHPNGPADLLVTFSVQQPRLASAPDDLLDTVDHYAWVFGTWEMAGHPEEQFSIAADHRYVHDEVRQVGSVGDSQFPYPTECHLRVTSNNVDLHWDNTGDHRSSLRLHGDITGISLVEDPRNSAACAAYVTREQGARTKLVKVISMGPNASLLLDGHQFTKVVAPSGD